jgi:hypothetical protein
MSKAVPDAVLRAWEQGNRPDAELPPELRHEKIREVRNVGASWRQAYQIVFDQSWLPYSYWNPQPEGWEITYARTEFHNDFNGIIGWLLPDRECICIVVTTTNPGSPFDTKSVPSGDTDE